ncbi:MAG: ABC transporter substrate-binding protein [Muricoprocola sp.]
MKRKKPFIVVFAGLFALLSIEPAGAQQLTEQIDDAAIVVGFSQIGSESDWRIANTQSVKDTLSGDGFYLLFEDAQQKQEKQVKAIRNFILQDVDYIVLNPIVETGWDLVLQEAKEARIPVIVVDRQVKVEDEDLYTCWIGSDFEKEGSSAGEWLASYLEEAGRDQEKINIVILEGTTGSSAQLGRTKGFESVQSEHGNWNVLDKQDGDFTQAKGKEVMKEMLSRYEDIDVLVSENDNMTFGAIEAIEESGRTCGPKGDMIVISFDAVKAAFDAMIEGNINADFECNPINGPRIKEVIQKLENGEEVEKIQYLEETYFDPSMDLEKIREGRTY